MKIIQKVFLFLMTLCLLIGFVPKAEALIQSSQTTARVSPVLERVVVCDNIAGYNAVWGYKNNNTDDVEIPIGSTSKNSVNKIDNNDPKPGQPNIFAVGRQIAVFSTFFPTGNSVWTIKTISGGSTATASSTAVNAIAGTCTALPPSS